MIARALTSTQLLSSSVRQLLTIGQRISLALLSLKMQLISVYIFFSLVQIQQSFVRPSVQYANVVQLQKGSSQRRQDIKIIYKKHDISVTFRSGDYYGCCCCEPPSKRNVSNIVLGFVTRPAASCVASSMRLMCAHSVCRQVLSLNTRYNNVRRQIDGYVHMCVSNVRRSSSVCTCVCVYLPTA